MDNMFRSPEYTYSYHFLQPITLLGIKDKNNFTILKKPIPAFYLMGYDQIKEEGGELKVLNLAVDIGLLLTGTGEIAMLKNLRGGYKIIKGVFLATEISSTSLDILLNYSEICTEGKFCENLRKCNFWIQMASLSGSLAIQKMAERSTKELIESYAKEKPTLPKEVATVITEISGKSVVKESLSSIIKNKLSWSNDLIKEFESTFKGAKSLENAQSWKLLKDTDRTKLMNNPNAVKKLADILSDKSIQRILGTETDDILKKFLITHKNDNWSWNKFSLETHLEKLKNIANKYEGVEGFNKSLRDALNNPAPAVQDGLWHMITDLEKRNISKDKIKAFDLEFDGEDLPCIKCKFDVELITQNSNELKYLEYKSYTDASKISQPQFLNYIANINDIKQLQYVFNKNKLSLDDAKNGMKKFFDKNKEEVFKVMNSELRQNLFGKFSEENQMKIFEKMIQDNNSQLYNFIKL